MRTLLALTALRTWKRVVALALGLGIFELIAGLSYSSADQALLRELIDGLPPAFRALAASAGSDISTPTGYLGSGYFHPVALALQSAVVISLAAGIARDVEDGVAELLLTRPVARWRWLTAHAIWICLALAIVALGGFIGGAVATVSISQLAGIPVGDLALTSLGGWLVFAVVAGVGLVVAQLVRTAGRVVGICAGFVLVSYALNYLATVWEAVRPIGPLSIFHYFEPALILTEGHIPGRSVWTLGVLTLCLGALALVLGERREVAP